MAEWTEKELEELFGKMTQKSMTDAEFRKEVLEDATKALEKLAGKPLPEGASLKCIEKDPNYQTTLVLPDFIDEEKIDDGSLAEVAGGVNVALIVTICIAAGGVGPDILYCTGKACAADACIAASCSFNNCAAKACALDSARGDCSAEACADYRE